MVIILLVLSFFVLLRLIKKYEGDMKSERYAIQQDILVRINRISADVNQSKQILQQRRDELNKMIKSNRMKLSRLNTKLSKELVNYNPNVSFSSTNSEELIHNLLLLDEDGGKDV